MKHKALLCLFTGQLISTHSKPLPAHHFQSTVTRRKNENKKHDAGDGGVGGLQTSFLLACFLLRWVIRVNWDANYASLSI